MLFERGDLYQPKVHIDAEQMKLVSEVQNNPVYSLVSLISHKINKKSRRLKVIFQLSTKCSYNNPFSNRNSQAG